MKGLQHKALSIISGLAMFSAFSIFGLVCSTWFGQEKTPQALIDMEV